MSEGVKVIGEYVGDLEGVEEEMVEFLKLFATNACVCLEYVHMYTHLKCRILMSLQKFCVISRAPELFCVTDSVWH